MFSCNKDKKDHASTGTIVATLITAISGMIFGLGNVFDDDFQWPSFGSSSANSNFHDSKFRTRLVDLKGDWLFSIGDESERANPNFNDESWSTIDVPSNWESEGYRGYDGFAWYRRQFSIEIEDTGKPLFIGLGKIDDADEVYLNGHLIGSSGSFPPNAATAWNKDRIYHVPNNILHPGEDNVIAVRVYDATQDGGIKNGTIGIYTTDLPQPLVELSGLWKFKTGDDENWRDETFDDSSFETMSVPALWEDAGHPNYNGFAWYRKTFSLDTSLIEETSVLMLGKIDDTDEVFINGERIGGTGTLTQADRGTNHDYYLQQRLYEFPSSLLKSGPNTLAVRVHDSTGGGGIYEGPLAIMTKSDHAEYNEMVSNSTMRGFRSSIDWWLGRD